MITGTNKKNGHKKSVGYKENMIEHKYKER